MNKSLSNLPEDEQALLHEGALLQLLTIHQLAGVEKATFPTPEPLPKNPVEALKLVKAAELETRVPYVGELGELIRQLQEEKPDIIGESQQQQAAKKSLWQRILATLGIN